MKDIRGVVRVALLVLCCAVATSAAPMELTGGKTGDMMEGKDIGEASSGTTSNIGEGDGMVSARMVATSVDEKNAVAVKAVMDLQGQEPLLLRQRMREEDGEHQEYKSI